MRPAHVAAAIRARTDRSLNEGLARLGWSSEPYRFGKRAVYDATGTHVGNLTAGDVWALLRERGLVEEVES